MEKGSVTKLVRSFGSTWGMIRPVGQAREVFFNQEALVDPSDYANLELGLVVDFEEEQDRANGSHAIQVKRSQPGISIGS